MGAVSARHWVCPTARQLLAIATICLIASSARSADAQLVSSTFDTDTEGWTSVGTNPSLTAQVPDQGNPGGCLKAVDLDSGHWYFVAPASYRGDKSAAANGFLRFDMRPGGTPNQGPGDQAVLISGGGLTLGVAVPFPAPSPAWTHYELSLGTGAAWRVVPTGTLATQSQIEDVLSTVTDLRIHGDWVNDIDTSFLDNVALVVECPGLLTQPEPASACASGSATFSVTAAGAGPFEFQWQAEVGVMPDTWVDLSDHPGVNALSGTQSDTLTISNVAASAAGRYRVIITNFCGIVQSNPATLTLGGSADFDADGDVGTDLDIEAFFRVLGGGSC